MADRKHPRNRRQTLEDHNERMERRAKAGKRQRKRKKLTKDEIADLCYTRAERRACTHKCMPKWVDREVIKDIYKSCPRKMTIDHIIPLNHSEICGLHVPWNLQYLTDHENQNKGNFFEEKRTVGAVDNVWITIEFQSSKNLQN